MKRLIIKTSFFILPFAFLYLITLSLYSDSESPDLLRLGGIPTINKDYRNSFSLNAKEKFDKLSKPTKKKYKILTIGDSFSEQFGYGYKNILANDFSVLHVDRFLSKNPLQMLSKMVNGDFFDKYDIEYVILQNVERSIINNTENIRLAEKIKVSQIDSLIHSYKTIQEDCDYRFFSRMTLKLPLNTLPKFCFQKNYLSNEQVYNVEMNSESLFSNHSKKLLFYVDDLVYTSKNNDKKNVDQLNSILNTISGKLRKKNIKLIILPSPDKYDFYYDCIKEKKGFTKPLFFDLMREIQKNYIYVDSKAILKAVKNKPDIYFYDDTHWSPIASKVIAGKIKAKIKSGDEK